MGRMFRIITENGHESAQAVARPADDVPFVEVGGPEGVVTSIPKPAPRVAPVVVVAPPVVAVPEPTPEPEESPGPRPLAVAFHRFPKAGLRLMPAGVSPDLIAYHQPDHPISGDYRAIRDEVRKQFEESGPRVVFFTSASPVAGTTTVLLNFAVAVTHETGARALVVDANLDRPSVARRLGMTETPGLAEVLGQSVPLAWALQPSAIPNLHALAAGVPIDGTDAAMAADFPRLLAQLRQWFDWILIDGGVWDESLGREAAGPACDAVYLVTRAADLDRPEFTGLRASVASAGGLLRGYVTTRL